MKKLNVTPSRIKAEVTISLPWRYPGYGKKHHEKLEMIYNISKSDLKRVRTGEGK